MCLIATAWRPGSAWPLVMAANRDEFFDRPSAPAQWWQTHPDVLAGQDLLAGGTWLGINRLGAFAALTNVRASNRAVAQRSRGHLPSSWLISQSKIARLDTKRQDEVLHAARRRFGKVATTAAFTCCLAVSERLSQPNPNWSGLATTPAETHVGYLSGFTLGLMGCQSTTGRRLAACERLWQTLKNQTCSRYWPTPRPLPTPTCPIPALVSKSSAGYPRRSSHPGSGGCRFTAHARRLCCVSMPRVRRFGSNAALMPRVNGSIAASHFKLWTVDFMILKVPVALATTVPS